MIVKLLKDAYVGSRLYAEGVEYAVDDETGKALVKSCDAEEVKAEDDPPKTN